MEQWNVFLDWVEARTFIDAAELFFVTLTVIGQRLNAGRDVRGYYFWITSNVCAVVFFCSLGRWMSVMLYTYLAAECIRGIIIWRRLEVQALKDAPYGAAAGA
jgi:nicotinamide riboside transporter PnuC